MEVHSAINTVSMGACCESEVARLVNVTATLIKSQVKNVKLHLHYTILHGTVLYWPLANDFLSAILQDYNKNLACIGFELKGKVVPVHAVNEHE